MAGLFSGQQECSIRWNILAIRGADFGIIIAGGNRFDPLCGLGEHHLRAVTLPGRLQNKRAVLEHLHRFHDAQQGIAHGK
jgi:hypothetical protein